MLASVPPFANPAWNAALLWAASCAWFPGTAGERAPPAMLKPACSGGLLNNWSATVPGKESPNDRVLKAKGRPGEAKARQPLDRGVVRQDLVLARDNRLVVRLVYVVRDVEEVSAQPGKTVGLAYRVGEVLTSQREGQL